MSESKRKILIGEFKAIIALEAISVIKTLNQIVQDCGVHPTQVSLWNKEPQGQASKLFDAKLSPKPVDPSYNPERL
jgi:transposase